jgi:glycosyltransferase involved in cell wall biosynthesis
MGLVKAATWKWGKGPCGKAFPLCPGRSARILAGADFLKVRSWPLNRDERIEFICAMNRQMADTKPVVRPESNADIPPCLSVVVPVYNEAGTVVPLLELVLAQRPVQEVLVVDDASRDDTWQELQSLPGRDARVKLFRHEKNQGKGAALRTGLARAIAPYVLIQDADLEYDPSEYHLLLAPVLAGVADVVFGSRFAGAGSHRVLYYWHSLGNKLITTLSNMATDLNLTDIETCYKLFRREVLGKISIEENRFGFEPEITAKVSRLKLRIFEVPISYYGRTYAEGKKIGWRDGFSALRCIIKYNLLR